MTAKALWCQCRLHINESTYQTSLASRSSKTLSLDLHRHASLQFGGKVKWEYLVTSLQGPKHNMPVFIFSFEWNVKWSLPYFNFDLFNLWYHAIWCEKSIANYFIYLHQLQWELTVLGSLMQHCNIWQCLLSLFLDFYLCLDLTITLRMP